MKVYLVLDRDASEGTETLIYGVFTKEDMAKKIADDLNRNFAEHNENDEVAIKEFELDEVTEDYHFFMNN